MTVTETGAGVVIVGASLAGGRAAELLRKQGFAGRLVLVGADPERPYDRPPLSKKFLRGAVPEEQLFLRPAEWYAEQRIELVTGVRAMRLDTALRLVSLEDGRTLPYERLLIATGADVLRLSCPGAGLRGVHELRTLGDARALRSLLAPGKRAVVVGAGVIGCETAASLREEGLHVTVLEAAELPLVRAFGPVVGKMYGELHRARGVDLRCSVRVAELRGAERVEEVVTADGERVACDVVVVGIGVRPATAWLEGSGVEVEDGVVVDAHAETNVKGVYAAGDVARGPLPYAGGLTRVESVDNARAQAAQFVAAVLGREPEPPPVPYFWSDQYELKLQIVGHVGPFDDVVFRGDTGKPAFVAFHLQGGRLRFAVGVNRLKEIGPAKRVIAAQVPVDRALLADESASLAALLPAP